MKGAIARWIESSTTNIQLGKLNQHFLLNSFHSGQRWVFVWKETKSNHWKKKKVFPSWKLIFLLQKYHAVELKKKSIKILYGKKILCQTPLLFEFDDKITHFSWYMSKRSEKVEQQVRKSSGTCLHDFFLETGRRRKQPAKKGPSLQFPSVAFLLKRPNTHVINRSIALLSPLNYTCKLESSSLSTMQTLGNILFTFGFQSSHPAVTWALPHVWLRTQHKWAI